MDEINLYIIQQRIIEERAEKEKNGIYLCRERMEQRQRTVAAQEVRWENVERRENVA